MDYRPASTCRTLATSSSTSRRATSSRAGIALPHPPMAAFSLNSKVCNDVKGMSSRLKRRHLQFDICSSKVLKAPRKELIEKLSVKKSSGQSKLKVLKDIPKEHQIGWDTTESEHQELLKPPEELIKGPGTFVEVSNMPVTTTLTPHLVQPIPSFKIFSDSMERLIKKSKKFLASPILKTVLAQVQMVYAT